MEFVQGGQAKAAFRALAYKPFHGAPLYLEWAPKELFEAEGSNNDRGEAESDDEGDKTEAPVAASYSGADESDSIKLGSVFVKNLHFDTKTEGLKKLFCKEKVSASSGNAYVQGARVSCLHQGFRAARVVTRMDPKRGELSMGYGFVEFDSPENALKTIKKLSGVSGMRLSYGAKIHIKTITTNRFDWTTTPFSFHYRRRDKIPQTSPR